MNARRRTLLLAAAAAILSAAALFFFPGLVVAQKVQEDYKDKFNISEGTGVAIAVSQDGKYVYVAGPEGVIVSDDYGKTGTWVQTVRLK